MITDLDNFELIFEGLDDDSEGTRKKLLDVLGTQCVSQIFEVESLLDGGPFLLKRSANKKELEISFQELRSAGAKVLIVKAKDRPLALRKSTKDQHPSSTTDAGITTKRESEFKKFFKNYTSHIHEILNQLVVEELEALIYDLLQARENKRQIFIFGNGGSAASASHMANDFSKQRFEDESFLFRVMSLTDNVSWLTATANDVGYDHVFVSQLKNLLQPGDIAIGISSSGNSPNVTRAIQYANSKGATTYGIVGFNGGELKDQAKKIIYIPTKVGQYGYMEDVTLIINHMVSIFIYEQDREALGSEKAH